MWVFVALVFLGVELLVAPGFFLGLAAAAGFMALGSWLVPEASWQMSSTAFAVLSLVFTLLYLKVFKGVNEKTDAPLLNDRLGDMVGQCFILEKSIPKGDTHLVLDDAGYKVRSSQALGEGQSIVVSGVVDGILVVEKSD